jgi:hypothetical protein
MGFFRHIKTTNERRQWYACMDWKKEYPDIRVRWRRSSKHLPNYYDEAMRSDGEDRSWKNYRLTQYRPKREARPKQPRPKVIWHSELVFVGYGWFRSGCHWNGWRHWFPYRARKSYRHYYMGDS